jgi:hypothetical protein
MYINTLAYYKAIGAVVVNAAVVGLAPGVNAMITILCDFNLDIISAKILAFTLKKNNIKIIFLMQKWL